MSLLSAIIIMAINLACVIGWVRAKKKLIHCEYERDMYKIGEEPKS